MRITSIFLLIPHLSLSAIAAPSRTFSSTRQLGPEGQVRVAGIPCTSCSRDACSAPPVVPSDCPYPSNLAKFAPDHDPIADLAIRSARGLINTAYLSLPDIWDTRMVKWFGPWDQGRNNIIRYNFEQLYKLDLARIVVSNGTGCDGDQFAYTPPDGFPEVYLCPQFFKKDKFKGQAGALIHEVTHFQCVANTNYWPEQYEGGCAAKLAKDCPNDATRNADNYRQYVLEFQGTFGCSRAQIQAINQVHANALSMAGDASTFLAMYQDEVSPLMKTWFGEFTDDQNTILRSNFKRITELIILLEYTCASDCAPGEFGLVRANRFPSVELCPRFFSQVDQVGDVINLWSQLPEVAGANLSPAHRGPEACKSLAETDPDSAMRNPDNYRYFIKAAAQRANEDEDEDEEGTLGLEAIQRFSVPFNRVLAAVGASLH